MNKIFILALYILMVLPVINLTATQFVLDRIVNNTSKNYYLTDSDTDKENDLGKVVATIPAYKTKQLNTVINTEEYEIEGSNEISAYYSLGLITAENYLNNNDESYTISISAVTAKSPVKKIILVNATLLKPYPIYDVLDVTQYVIDESTLSPFVTNETREIDLSNYRYFVITLILDGDNLEQSFIELTGIE